MRVGADRMVVEHDALAPASRFLLLLRAGVPLAAYAEQAASTSAGLIVREATGKRSGVLLDAELDGTTDTKALHLTTARSREGVNAWTSTVRRRLTCDRPG
jgi:hypothetical protein